MPEQREIGHGGGEERKGEVKAIHSPVLFQLYHKNIPILLSHFLCFIQFKRDCVNLVNGEIAIFFLFSSRCAGDALSNSHVLGESQ